MAHKLTLDDWEGLLERETLQDFLDLFFGGRESEFLIEVVPTYGETPNPAIRGLCMTNFQDKFKITLYAGNIQEQMGRGVPMGGNFTKARNLKHGLYLVLTHELRHAYQAIYFGKNGSLHKGKYKARAGEVDARRYVDENYEAVCDFLGMEPELIKGSEDEFELSIYLDILAEGASPEGVVSATDDQVWDQIMTMPGDPDVLHRRLMDGLRSRGLRLG